MKTERAGTGASSCKTGARRAALRNRREQFELADQVFYLAIHLPEKFFTNVIRLLIKPCE